MAQDALTQFNRGFGAAARADKDGDQLGIGKGAAPLSAKFSRGRSSSAHDLILILLS